MNKKTLGFLICTLLITSAVLPVTGKLNISKSEDFVENISYIFDDYPLPPPISVDMILEESICRRMSTREAYTSQQVTDEELSTVLWAAFGTTENGNRSIYLPDGSYSTIIYVIMSDATYKYVPESHSLSLFKNGNYLYIGQNDGAPIKFGLVWNKSIINDELIGMAEIGMIAQNIYFDAIALDLATITTGAGVDELNDLGLPSNEKPEIIMPLGHPSSPYDFDYSPLPPSNLPIIVNNTYSLEDVINNRLISYRWDNIPLSEVEESQLIWSSYGYSYLWDNVNNKRHRTLPSAIGVYPFKVYAADQDGVYLYDPSTHSVTTIVEGDRREEINNSLGSSDIWTATASWIIIPFYNTNNYPQYLNWWYYEVGAISHNIILEATALNLSANIITDISDINGLRSALGISSQTNLQPWFVIPVGNSWTIPNKTPDIPTIDGETSGSAGTAYTYTFNSIDSDGDDVYYYIKWGDGYIENWDGPHQSGEDFEITHTYANQGTFTIQAKAKDTFGAESDWGTLEVTIPRNKAIYRLGFQFLLESFPILEVIISRIKNL
ncbi:MAG: nitroreductase family protein [Thermoplasmatales archaeon]|nr:MAG: nitroreductase family protein [Thermoplasmatales archaeon]